MQQDIYVGTTIGKLYVDSIAYTLRKPFYKCICECGNELILPHYRIKSSHNKSCGCLKPGIKEVLWKDKKFGKLQVIKSYPESKKVLCKCECGTEKLICWNDLFKTKSCGCIQKEKTENCVNKYVLDIITPKSAYFIGLMLTDGCVTDKNCIRLYLHGKDKDILSRINDWLEIKRELYKRKDAVQFGIVISSKYLSNKLKEYNIVPRKSKICTVPESLKYNSHFWRGMIDGDGAVSFNKIKKRYHIRFCGTIDCCNSFLEYCKYLGITTTSKVSIKKNIDNFGEVQLAHQHAYLFCKTVYNVSNDEFFIERKYNNAQNIIKHYETTDIDLIKSRGCSHYKSKLTKNEIITIFYMIDTHQNISELFNIHRVTVTNIKNKKSYKTITADLNKIDINQIQELLIKQKTHLKPV